MATAPDLVFELDVSPDLAHIDQYFGVYAMHEERLHAIVQQVKSMDLNAHIVEQRTIMATGDGGNQMGAYQVRDGVAVIDVKGTMTKYGSSLSQMRYGTIGVRKALRSAAQDSEVKSILLVVESPGGTAQGTQDLADEVTRAAQSKRVTAYIEDIGASAAYWVASQADRVIANSSAMVGSIGTYGVVHDWSEAARMDGVKVHVIRAGQFKGGDVPGAPIAADTIADFQRVVTEINDLFVAGVAKGRKLTEEQARLLADGRVHIASRALDLKLIDEIGAFDEVLNSLVVGQRSRSRIGAASTHKELSTMSDQDTVSAGTPTKPQAASIDDIIACCPHDPDVIDQATYDSFVLAQAKRKATIDQAQTAFMELQNREIASAKAKLADRDKKIAEAASAKDDELPPLASGGKPTSGDGGDPLEEFPALVESFENRGYSKPRALAAAVKKNPDLHRAYLVAYNASHGRVIG